MFGGVTRVSIDETGAGVVSLDELIRKNLEVNLRAQNDIAEAVSQTEYITGQPADKVADLYGVLADKAIRILEAAQREKE